MFKGQIYANNTLIKEKVKVPEVADILCFTENELDGIKAIKLVKGAEHIEQGSTFVSYSTRASSIEEVNKAYCKMKIKYTEATHISCAYHLKNPKGPFDQQAIDDKEFGAARKILSVLKERELAEMAVFVVREYGGRHLGKRRFEVIEQVAEKAVQAWFRTTAKKLQRVQRSQSQESLESLNSFLENDQDQDKAEDGWTCSSK